MYILWTAIFDRVFHSGQNISVNSVCRELVSQVYMSVVVAEHVYMPLVDTLTFSARLFLHASACSMIWSYNIITAKQLFMRGLCRLRRDDRVPLVPVVYLTHAYRLHQK